MVYPLTVRQSLSEINHESRWAFFRIEGFAGKRSLLSPPPPPSLVLFALAPFFARPECENSFSRPDTSFRSYGNACYAGKFGLVWFGSVWFGWGSLWFGLVGLGLIRFLPLRFFLLKKNWQHDFSGRADLAVSQRSAKKCIEMNTATNIKFDLWQA